MRLTLQRQNTRTWSCALHTIGAVVAGPTSAVLVLPLQVAYLLCTPAQLSRRRQAVGGGGEGQALCSLASYVIDMHAPPRL